MYKFLFLPLLLVFSLTTWAQPTFSEDIASIIYNNCSVCHRSGEVGPMSLTNYEEVSNWASMIEYVTSIKYMPPWKADPAYSHFIGERGLTDSEIQLISDWVAAGSPQGNPANEPALPDFPVGSQVGQPDLVLSFAEAFTHTGNMEDQYQVFVLPTNLTEDKVLKAIELRPGNPALVHHALFASDISGQAQILDANTPEYGYEDFGGFGVPTDDFFPAYAPGAKPHVFPLKMGQSLKANSDLLVQMHYAPSPIDQTDSSTVNIFFADPAEEVDRFIETFIMLPNNLQNGPFVIPPQTIKTFHGIQYINSKTTLLGIAPHMHLIGVDWEVFAVQPNGDTTNLISVPEWDFNWQGYYFFTEPAILEPGAFVHAYATYDNTDNNPNNPNDPPITMAWGEGTTDEMYYLPLLYVSYEPGDEDLNFEDEVTNINELGFQIESHKLYPINPNPSNGDIIVGYSTAYPDEIRIDLYDAEGKQLQNLVPSTLHTKDLFKRNISLDLAPGIYFIRMRSQKVNLVEKLIIQ